MGAVSVVTSVWDAPADRAPTLRFAVLDVVPPAASAIVTATDRAAAVPLLATVSCSVVVPPALRRGLVSFNALGTTSAFATGAGVGAGPGAGAGAGLGAGVGIGADPGAEAAGGFGTDVDGVGAGFGAGAGAGAGLGAGGGAASSAPTSWVSPRGRGDPPPSFFTKG